MSSDGLGSVPKVWTEPALEPGSGNPRFQKDPGFGDSVAKVPKVALYFESILLYFESMLLYVESIFL